MVTGFGRPFTAELQRQGMVPGRMAGAAAVPQPPALSAELAGSVMASLDRIERRLAELAPAGPPEAGPATGLEEELEGLRHRVRQTQIEIAALRHPLAEQDRLVVAGEELAAIVQATERATSSLLGDAEFIDRAAAAIRDACIDPEIAAQADAIQQAIIRIYEACNFQDITGQRIAKVVRTLDFIEERVAAMVQTWGAEAFENLPRPDDVQQNDEAKLLNGPQLEGRAITQAEIDALFG